MKQVPLQIKQLGTRNFIFTHDLGDWTLTLQLIKGKNRNYIIDSGLGSLSVAPLLEHIKSEDKALVLINTHHHWDHTWGNGFLNAAFHIAHIDCPKLMLGSQDEAMQKNARYIMGEAALALPNLLITQEVLFSDDNICIFPTPGHTRDSISVFDMTNGVLNIGDNIGDSLEGEDVLPSIATGKEIYLATIAQYEKMNVAHFVGGHCGVLNRLPYERIRDYL